MPKITLAISGASGMPYAFRLLECLLKANVNVNVVVSQAAHIVIAMETPEKLSSEPKKLQAQLCERYQVNALQLQVYGHQQWMAPIASGTGAADAMVVCPCSGGCLAAIATGQSNNLLERAADVMLKERRPLILVPRETPLSSIHLEHLLKLSQLGVSILPANPGFYHYPETINDLIDFIVARILDQLNVPQNLIEPWGQSNMDEVTS